MVYLQISANTGPVECCLAVVKAVACLTKEAIRAGVSLSIVEQVDGPMIGTLRSVLLTLSDDNGSGAAQNLAEQWQGSLLWVCSSPYRPTQRRKNWFLGVTIFHLQVRPLDGDIRFEATRASGPGGQHVNKTDSAIRATHVATGLSVKVQTERSQHANKRLAAQLLMSKLAEIKVAKQREAKTERHLQHKDAERGNAKRIFTGIDFREQRP